MSDHTYCTVTKERDGHVWVVTLNRPEVYNALHAPAHDELSQVFDDFAADKDAWVGVVTGSGDRAFCAGNDLKYQATGGDMTTKSTNGFGGLTSRFDLNKPLIAAVNGFAMGGGFEIALACDIIVAAESATFALPEPLVGLAALAGGLHRLPRAIGEKQAFSMMLTGRRVQAAEGKDLGFVAEVVPGGESVVDAALRWADDIAKCSPMSVRATKEAVQRGLDIADLETAMETRFPAVKAMLTSKDFVEGPLAFAEKRAPQWKGE